MACVRNVPFIVRCRFVEGEGGGKMLSLSNFWVWMASKESCFSSMYWVVGKG